MDNDSFYRPSGKVKDTNRTYVPDLYRQVAAEMQAEDGISSNADSMPSHMIRLQNRQIIGVLYSISAGIEGELFPVYVGRNIIGSDLTCDICLRETSVSAQHALMLARKQTDAEGEEYINVILSDNNSSYGTSINGERLNYEKVNCADGDILTFGQNYVLVFSLFNALGKLSVAYGFDRIPEPKKPAASVIARETFDRDNSIEYMPPMPIDDHSTNITQNQEEQASNDFYKPTKQQKQDHYNNKTIIL